VAVFLRTVTVAVTAAASAAACGVTIKPARPLGE
jgi:hypothetical protein